MREGGTRTTKLAALKRIFRDTLDASSISMETTMYSLILILNEEVVGGKWRKMGIMVSTNFSNRTWRNAIPTFTHTPGTTLSQRRGGLKSRIYPKTFDNFLKKQGSGEYMYGHHQLMEAFSYLPHNEAIDSGWTDFMLLSELQQKFVFFRHIDL